MAISNKYPTESDVVYMEYEVADVEKDNTYQQGFIVTRAPKENYPFANSNGWMTFKMFGEDEMDGDKLLLREGARYFICFVKKEESCDVVIQRTMNGVTETLSLPNLAAKETDIRAEYTGLLDMPCQDSCLEFFFCPMEGDARYFNIEFNPNCCMYLGLGSCLQDLVRLFPAWGNVLCPQAARTDDGWEITYQVPASFVRRFFPEFQLKSGKIIRANFYKCGDLTKEYHELCWNKLAEGEHDFHRSCDFGVLVLE